MRSRTFNLIALSGLIACGGTTTKAKTKTKTTQPVATSTTSPTKKHKPPAKRPAKPRPREGAFKHLVGKQLHTIKVVGAGKWTKSFHRVIESQAGKPLDVDRVVTDIQAIWATRRVKGVHVTAKLVPPNQVALTFIVTMRPIVRSIYHEGHKQLTLARLRAGSRVTVRTFLAMADVYAERSRIASLYTDIGYFATVKAETYSVRPGDEIDVVFKITEHNPIKVSAVTFPGASKARARALAPVLGESNGINTTGHSYSNLELRRGLLRVTAYYYDRGFINVKVLEPHISHAKGKDSVALKIRLKEGPVFRYGKLTAKGKLLAPVRTYLKMAGGARPGDIFNRSQVGKWLKRIAAFHKKKGRPKLNVTPLTNVDLKTKTVSLTLQVD